MWKNSAKPTGTPASSASTTSAYGRGPNSAAPEAVLGRDHLVQQALVLGERADERENLRDVVDRSRRGASCGTGML